MIRIDRCACLDRTFDSLLALAEAEHLSLEQLVRETGAGNGCSLCRPYLREALKTGRVVFNQVITDEQHD